MTDVLKKSPTIKGLVLAGGLSQRFGSDKAKAKVGQTKLSMSEQAYGLLKGFCSEVRVACRREQNLSFSEKTSLFDQAPTSLGPAAGLLSAYAYDPEASWFVLACDYCFVDTECIEFLLKQHQQAIASSRPAFATVFGEKWTPKAEAKGQEKWLYHPLVGIWTPPALFVLEQRADHSPQMALQVTRAAHLRCPNPDWLKNINFSHDLLTQKSRSRYSESSTK